MEESFGIPLPSWPELLLPQQLIRPPDKSAQV
jgi:hypothetical protein